MARYSGGGTNRQRRAIHPPARPEPQPQFHLLVPKGCPPEHLFPPTEGKRTHFQPHQIPVEDLVWAQTRAGFGAVPCTPLRQYYNCVPASTFALENGWARG
jgi:hypothetical protein